MELRKRWTEAGRRQGLHGQRLKAYSSRWSALWASVARALRSSPGGWQDHYALLMEDFVEARRAAADHQAAAEADPYPRGPASRPFPHPGFAAAEAARREAREVLSRLRLAPGEWPVDDGGGVADGGVADEPPEPPGDQVGL